MDEAVLHLASLTGTVGNSRQMKGRNTNNPTLTGPLMLYNKIYIKPIIFYFLSNDSMFLSDMCVFEFELNNISYLLFWEV